MEIIDGLSELRFSAIEFYLFCEGVAVRVTE